GVASDAVLEFESNLCTYPEAMVARHRRLYQGRKLARRWPSLPPQRSSYVTPVQPEAVMLFRLEAAEAYFSLGINRQISPKVLLFDMDDIESEAARRRLSLDGARLGRQASFHLWRQARLLQR